MICQRLADQWFALAQNDWSARHWQITILYSILHNNFWLFLWASWRSVQATCYCFCWYCWIERSCFSSIFVRSHEAVTWTLCLHSSSSYPRVRNKVTLFLVKLLYVFFCSEACFFTSPCFSFQLSQFACFSFRLQVLFSQ